MNPTLENLLETGRQMLAHETEEKRIRQRKAQQERQAERIRAQEYHEQEAAKVRAVIEKILPECLHEFIQITSRINESTIAPMAILRIPDLVDIQLKEVRRAPNGDWIAYNLFWIAWQEGDNIYGGHDSAQTNDIQKALALAEQGARLEAERTRILEDHRKTWESERMRIPRGLVESIQEWISSLEEDD